MGKEIKCIIDEVKFKESNLLSPILVTFQNGELLPEKATTLKCSVIIDKKRKNRTFSLDSGTTISYKGSPSIENEDSCKTMLAIRNCKTNKIRLVESEMMILAPFIDQERKKLEEDLNLSYADKMFKLAHSFGSKRGKRINEMRERTRTVNTELNEGIKQALDSVDVSFTELPQDCAVGGIPWNCDAKKVEDVYKLHDLISKEQLRSLKQEARDVKNAAQDTLVKKYSPFFVASLPLILEKNSKDKKQLKLDLELLVYIDYLILHTKCNLNKPFADTEKICTTSSSVNEKLIQEFSLPATGNTRLCTTMTKDKASCHVIVLSLLLFNFQVCLKLLATALNHSIAKLKTFSQALGASCPKDSTVATLRVPLILPRQSGMAKRNSKRR